MSLSVDDEVTLVEVAVILVGVVITWAAYRWAEDADPFPTAPPPRRRDRVARDRERGEVE
ncbi:MAG TPA: hypothetical protein VEH57_08580 [Thermoplasmata archaeon]|nr:hypothetical protein [Thermoplasmata archaeon]